mmetsp:Transcript_78166/g.217065  ORF Transcript_78166/g.217065 Transcript_78166/m.217065 type:complete len:236 (+) Transcript_78166:518-1225(+)
MAGSCRGRTNVKRKSLSDWMGRKSTSQFPHLPFTSTSKSPLCTATPFGAALFQYRTGPSSTAQTTKQSFPMDTRKPSLGPDRGSVSWLLTTSAVIGRWNTRSKTLFARNLLSSWAGRPLNPFTSTMQSPRRTSLWGWPAFHCITGPGLTRPTSNACATWPTQPKQRMSKPSSSLCLVTVTRNSCKGRPAPLAANGFGAAPAAAGAWAAHGATSALASSSAFGAANNLCAGSPPRR